MIYCNLKGGLGNMLFQIAATKSLSLDVGVNCSFPNLYTQLELINEDSTHNPKIKHSFDYKLLLKNLNVSPTKDIYNVIRFPFHYIKPPLMENIIIDGFFQSEKYFNHNRESILEFFDFSEISKVVESKYGDLLKKRTASIHVRRGDYIKYPNHHPTQSIKYYNKGIDLLRDKTDIFVVFSDDIEWCKKNFNIDNIIYIEDEKDYIELYLMSLCDNNIISNSSFSWWGAWLNTNENKTVIAPNKWFGSAINENTADIIPEGWIKI